jgi:hypothetical protein
MTHFLIKSSNFFATSQKILPVCTLNELLPGPHHSAENNKGYVLSFVLILAMEKLGMIASDMGQDPPPANFSSACPVPAVRTRLG